MKNLIFSMILGIGFILINSNAYAIDRDQAVTILTETIIPMLVTTEKTSDSYLNKSFFTAYGPQQALSTGDRVEPGIPVPASAFLGGDRVIENSTWFFWVDTNKVAKFAHPTYFVYISATHPNPTVNDGIIIDGQMWWPQINGSHYLESMDDRSTTSDLVFGNLNTMPTGLPE